VLISVNIWKVFQPFQRLLRFKNDVFLIPFQELFSNLEGSLICFEKLPNVRKLIREKIFSMGVIKNLNLLFGSILRIMFALNKKKVLGRL